jgi:hypothetical protein
MLITKHEIIVFDITKSSYMSPVLLYCMLFKVNFVISLIALHGRMCRETFCHVLR